MQVAFVIASTQVPLESLSRLFKALIWYCNTPPCPGTFTQLMPLSFNGQTSLLQNKSRLYVVIRCYLNSNYDNRKKKKKTMRFKNNKNNKKTKIDPKFSNIKQTETDT